MEEQGATEKFSVKIRDEEVEISAMRDGKKEHLIFTPSEALMLLDILKSESGKLKKMAGTVFPIPIHFDIGENDDN